MSDEFDGSDIEIEEVEVDLDEVERVLHVVDDLYQSTRDVIAKEILETCLCELAELLDTDEEGEGGEGLATAA